MNPSLSATALGLLLTACNVGLDGVTGDGGRSDGARTGDATYAVGDTNATRETYRCPGNGTEVSGTVLSPSGLDPIFGAVVYVTRDEPPTIAAGVACDTCLIPTGSRSFTTPAPTARSRSRTPTTTAARSTW